MIEQVPGFVLVFFVVGEGVFDACDRVGRSLAILVEGASHRDAFHLFLGLELELRLYGEGHEREQGAGAEDHRDVTVRR